MHSHLCLGKLLSALSIKALHDEATTAYLSPGPCHDIVLVVFGISLHFDVLAAAGRGHGEAPDLGGEVAADLLLLRIEAHTLADEVPAAVAPHVEGHLEADDQDALVQLLGALA